MADDALAPSQRVFQNRVSVDTFRARSGEGVAEAAVTPGAVLIKGTAALEVIEAGAGADNAIGWANDNISPPATLTLGSEIALTDNYAIGDRVQYWTAESTWFGIIADGAGAVTINKGDSLKCAAAGELTLLAAADSPALKVAVYEGEADVVTNGANARALCRWVK